MSLRLVGCTAVGVALAAALPAGEIRGRVLVDGKPDATVTVRALPFEDGSQEARREARLEGLPAPLAETTARADGTFVLSVTAAAGASVRLAFGGPKVAPRVLEAILDAAGVEVPEVRLAKEMEERRQKLEVQQKELEALEEKIRRQKENPP